MKQVRAFFQLIRPMTTLTGMLSTVVGGYVAGTGDWVSILLAALATGCITAAGNAWNDYLDVDIDRVNQPQRILPSGQVPLHSAWQLSVGLNLVAILLGIWINVPALLIIFASIFFLYLYSWKLKNTVLLGNLTVAIISAMSPVFGAVAAGNALPSWWLALIVGISILGREVLKTMADYEGDLSQKYRTVATVWGKHVSRNIFYLLAAASGIVMILPYLLQVYTPIYAYMVAFGVYPVLIYILWRVTHDMSPDLLNRMSKLMKYDYFIWFIAVVLGSI